MAQIPNSNALTVSDGQNVYFNVDTSAKVVQISNAIMSTQASATSPDPGANGQIATAGVGIALVTPAAARTGITLQPGTTNGQEVWVVNQGIAASTLTLNTTPATANVADSATETAIAGLTARKYVWIGGTTNLWYPSRD